MTFLVRLFLCMWIFTRVVVQWEPGYCDAAGVQPSCQFGVTFPSSFLSHSSFLHQWFSSECFMILGSSSHFLWVCGCGRQLSHWQEPRRTKKRLCSQPLLQVCEALSWAPAALAPSAMGWAVKRDDCEIWARVAVLCLEQMLEELPCIISQKSLWSN